MCFGNSADVNPRPARQYLSHHGSNLRMHWLFVGRSTYRGCHSKMPGCCRYHRHNLVCAHKIGSNDIISVSYTHLTLPTILRV